MNFAQLFVAAAAALAAETSAKPQSSFREFVIQASYLAASVLFILGLKGLTNPAKARQGMQLAAIGMLVAVLGTLLHHEIITYAWNIAGKLDGSANGAANSIRMPMTDEPPRTANTNA